jgi:hypothetical protein
MLASSSIMDAEKLILETDASGNLRHVPKLPPNKQLEVIFWWSAMRLSRM